MGYVKVVKNRNYYKRFQVKMKRRRQCKTDYALRRRLISQDKRKYNAPKWRYIVRITNKDVVCQVASSKVTGDNILCVAYSHELNRYGLKVGLTNYSACYCTGLLMARRLLQKLNIAEYYPGKKKLDGKKFRSHVANVRWKSTKHIYRPFRCLLDIGLARATTGARVFAALKGAVDGGLDIPHSEKRFPGFKKSKDKKKDSYDAGTHCDKIFGGHVRDYMKHLNKTNPEKYQAHFSKYIAQGLEADTLNEMYEKIHRAIRSDPSSAPKKKKGKKHKAQHLNPKKLDHAGREQNRYNRIDELIRIKKKKTDGMAID